MKLNLFRPLVLGLCLIVLGLSPIRYTHAAAGEASVHGKGIPIGTVMIIYVGEKTTFIKNLAKKLKAKVLVSSKGTETENLNEESVIVADIADQLSEEDSDFLCASMKKNATLVLQNLSTDNAPEWMHVCADASVCVIKSKAGGRMQEIVFEGKPRTDDPPDPESPAEPIEEKKLELSPDEYEELMTLSFAQGKTVEEFLDAEKEPTRETTEITKEERKKPDIIDLVGFWINDETFHNPENATKKKLVKPGTAETGNKQEMQRTAERGTQQEQERQDMYYSRVFLPQQKNWYASVPDVAPEETRAAYFMSFDVFIYATHEPKAKFVQLTSAGTFVAIPEGMAYDKKKTKGFFTNHGQIMYYPGAVRTHDKKTILLPDGWRRRNIQPESHMSETTYISTTGWEFSVNSSGNMGGKLSGSSQQSETIPDFRVKNLSEAAVCHWIYEHSILNEDESKMWRKHPYWDQPRTIKLSARSTMMLHNEAVYDLPPDTIGWQEFQVYQKHKTALLHGWMTWYGVQYRQRHNRQHSTWETFSINLASVKHID